jgi:hypothetical protein
MTDRSRIPAFSALAAALRKTTEYLAAEVVQPQDAAPDWGELEWAIARCVSAMQGVSTLLANGLRWVGPPLWQDFIAEQREQSVLRHELIGGLLARIDAALRARHVSCVALKGAALHAMDMYRAGERPMGDIDLLATSDDLQPIAAAMADIGYVEAYTTQRHRVYEPLAKTAPKGLGEHVDSPVTIEIHTAVAEPLPVRKVDITDRLRRGLAGPGLNPYPDLVSLLLHLLLHTAGNMRAHTLRQIQLHDIAAIASRLRDNDWESLLGTDGREGRRWWAYPALRLTERYYPSSVPLDVMREARSICPLPLRVASARESLTDVSWSNLHIHAFPGIFWSRTPLDALRFVRSRALPSKVALAELVTARKAQPQLEQVSWYGLSHGSRIVRWLFTRPPRVQTIVSVRAALESSGWPLE